jgi:signal transduction histidine kinase
MTSGDAILGSGPGTSSVPLPATPASLGTADELLERAYARLGQRIIAVSFVALEGLRVTLAIIGALTYARLEDLTIAQSVEIAALASLAAATGGAFAFVAASRRIRPINAWYRDRHDQAAAAAAWHAAHRLPAEILRWIVVFALLINFPGIVLAVGVFVPLSPELVLVMLISLIGILALFGSVAMFGFQLVMRPVIRDVGRSFDRPPLPPHGTSVRQKLLIALPAITLATVVGAVVMSSDPGVHWSRVLVKLLVLWAMTLVFVAPATILLAHSTLHPLDDLLRATERLKTGDYSTRVPELSADEYGALARSFNEAMEGLAERQRLAEDNERLLDEIRASRARIVAASDAERRRIERNIHDGAQQQLVAHALELRMLQEVAGSSQPQQIREMLEAAGKNVETALDELRELARGLHPSVLATDGLPPALRQLATRAPLPVTVNTPPERFPEAIESTAYFIACEALANIAKYARASNAEISIQRKDGRLLVEITDDGIGGAKQNEGSGLAGLADRVAAVDGTLTVLSPPGHGTTIKADLPLDLQSA